MYAYSRPMPLVRSSIPCNLATRVVFPDWLSPKNDANVHVKWKQKKSKKLANYNHRFISR